MKKLNSKLFIILFLVSFIVVLPFAIKGIASNDKNNIDVNDKTISQSEESLDTPQTTNVSEKATETITNKTTEPQTETTSSKEVEITKPKGKPTFKTSDKSYFDDALFIGDSRTVGLSEYGGLNNATFFSNTGMSVYNIHKTTVSIPSIGKVHLNELLQRKKYGKIYIMLGINELGYDLKKTIEKYDSLLKEIQSLQPNAIIYIEANLHVTKSRSDTDKLFNNKNINRFNNATKKLSNNQNVFYIDINEVFDDKSGSLRADYTNDNVHVYAKHYKKWGDWLATKTIKFV